MENSKETDLNRISETMLQTLYARAKESEKPKHKIYDQKAIVFPVHGNNVENVSATASFQVDKAGRFWYSKRQQNKADLSHMDSICGA